MLSELLQFSPLCRQPLSVVHNLLCCCHLHWGGCLAPSAGEERQQCQEAQPWLCKNKVCSLLSVIASCMQTSQAVAAICSRIFCISTLPQTNRPHKWQYAAFKIGIYLCENYISACRCVHLGPTAMGHRSVHNFTDITRLLKRSESNMETCSFLCVFCFWENCILFPCSQTRW